MRCCRRKPEVTEENMSPDQQARGCGEATLWHYTHVLKNQPVCSEDWN